MVTTGWEMFVQQHRTGLTAADAEFESEPVVVAQQNYHESSLPLPVAELYFLDSLQTSNSPHLWVNEVNLFPGLLPMLVPKLIAVMQIK